MARKFEFNSRKNRLELDIAGEEFIINTMDPLWLRKVDEGKKKLKESGDELTKFSKKDNADIDGLEEIMNRSIGICVEVLDALLGENATKRIFKDNPIAFLDIVDVISFVFEEADEYMEKDIVNKFSANRAQRRGKK